MKRNKHIGLNSFASSLAALFSKTKTEEKSIVQKTYGKDEDFFIDEQNKRLSQHFNHSTKTKERSFTKKEKFNRCQASSQDVSGDVQIRGGYCKMMSRWNRRKTKALSTNPYAETFCEFPKFQVTVSNKTLSEQEVLLWGADQSAGFINVNPLLPQDVHNHVIVAYIPTGVSPIGIVFNPVNNLIYAANQISGTVTVIDANNTVVNTIQLVPSFPGFCSPVSLCVNTNIASTGYGHVYVACSVANKVDVINLSFHVVASIMVGLRPMSVAYNPVNNRVYAVNLVSNNLSIIDPEINATIPGPPLDVFGNPIAVGIHPVNGEVYVAQSLFNSVIVFNSGHAFISSIPGTGVYPIDISFNPANLSMYVTAYASNSICQIDPVLYTILTTIPVGTKPTHSFFNSVNSFLYVLNASIGTISIIKADNSIEYTYNVGIHSTGGDFNSSNGLIYISDPAHNQVVAISYAGLTISDDYNEIKADLQYNIALVQHSRFIVTGAERIHSFRLNRFNMYGKLSRKALSMESYTSPQSGINVVEMAGLAGTIIDGKMNWTFKLPALHTVSILVWIRYFRLRDLLDSS